MPRYARRYLAAVLLTGLILCSCAGKSLSAHRVKAAYPNDPAFGKQWALHNTGQNGGKSGADIHILPAWKITHCSPKITIAVLDSGLDRRDPEFKGKIVWPRDFTNSGAGMVDENGHGTAVAATAAANTNNKRGIAGVCPRGRIMPVKVVGPTGRARSDAIVKGIRWAVDHGARIINMSFGTNVASVDSSAVLYAQARGVIMVASTANNGRALDNFPAGYPGVLAVGGTDRHDRRWRHSGYGPLNLVLAPAADVPVLLPIDDDVTAEDGDSFAAPQVSGLAGLILSVRPDLSPEQVYAAIERGADHVVGQHHFTNQDGWGRINCYRSLKIAEGMPR